MILAPLPLATERFRYWLLPAFVITLALVVLSTYLVLADAQRRIIDYEAVKIAEVVARQALAARTVYTSEVADKLAREGTGANEYSDKTPGHVPLPAQFLKLTGREAVRTSEGLYSYRPLSKWNLEPTQGLVDEFQRWGWNQLEEQDQAVPERPIDWQAVWRFETVNETRTLRYLRADPASTMACVNCHNVTEPQPQVVAMRASAGVAAGKQWRQHQLLGAIEVQIPMVRIETFAEDQGRNTVLPVLGISALGLVITGWLAWFDLRRQRGLSLRFERQAKFDSVTEVPNRSLFRERADDAIKRAARENGKAGLVFVDLDNFKAINDSLGHSAGDHVLHEVARRMAVALREIDTVARHSGDEFAIVINGMREAQDLAVIARKLADTLAQPLDVHGQTLFVTASMGLSVYPQDGTDVETLLKNADTAMYQAKQHGRNRFQFFSIEMNARALETLRLTADLGRAVARGEFELLFQPRISTDSGAVTCVEALVRWRHPVHGLLLPDQFVVLAEEAGLIGALGDWVLHKTCAEIANWRRRGLPPVRVAVNLSPRQFRLAGFAAHILGVAAQAGVPPEQLEFEITESVMMQNPELAETVLTELRSHGVAIAVDDFGTGYSSLSYLKRFPADTLKIDKSFVSGLPDDASDRAITRAVIAMAHGLNLHVVAEGVENEGQRLFLTGEGCKEMQGYLFSRPIDSAQLERFLREQAA